MYFCAVGNTLSYGSKNIVADNVLACLLLTLRAAVGMRSTHRDMFFFHSCRSLVGSNNGASQDEQDNSPCADPMTMERFGARGGTKEVEQKQERNVGAVAM